MENKKVFYCTDTSKLEELGFKKIRCSHEWMYSSYGQYRISIDEKRNGIMQFIHHCYDTYSMFKKMVELGIVVEGEKESHYDTKYRSLENRIKELERKLYDKQD